MAKSMRLALTLVLLVGAFASTNCNQAQKTTLSFVAAAQADECGYKSDGKYHCGGDCGYKSDGKYHCGSDCGYKSDGNYHCIGEDESDTPSPSRPPSGGAEQSACGYKADGNYHCGNDCSYKSDGKFHCGADCGYKSDGQYHCSGD